MAVSDIGLPDMLTNMLGTIIKSNKLNSWNIYENRPGVICVNIRFTADIAIEGSGTYEQPMHYRRQSDRQVTRNRDRARIYHNKHTHTEPAAPPMSTPTLPPLISTPPQPPPSAPFPPLPTLPTLFQVDYKKRKFDTLSPEIARMDTPPQPLTLDTIVSPYTPPIFQPREEDTSSQYSFGDSSICTIILNTHDYESVPKECADPHMIEDGSLQESEVLTMDMQTDEYTAPPLSPLASPFTYQTSHSSSPSGKVTSNGTNNIPILCPCCDCKMTIDHECENDQSNSVTEDINTSETLPSTAVEYCAESGASASEVSVYPTSVRDENYAKKFAKMIALEILRPPDNP